jgi:hypothetical protein
MRYSFRLLTLTFLTEGMDTEGIIARRTVTTSSALEVVTVEGFQKWIIRADHLPDNPMDTPRIVALPRLTDAPMPVLT